MQSRTGNLVRVIDSSAMRINKHDRTFFVKVPSRTFRNDVNPNTKHDGTPSTSFPGWTKPGTPPNQYRIRVYDTIDYVKSKRRVVTVRPCYMDMIFNRIQSYAYGVPLYRVCYPVLQSKLKKKQKIIMI